MNTLIEEFKGCDAFIEANLKSGLPMQCSLLRAPHRVRTSRTHSVALDLLSEETQNKSAVRAAMQWMSAQCP